ncbi:hypothetical protein [Candidatus Uabimicrobium amorphum]|uniref:Uncharacterized protein n=1 Tax=Uabimicrobium amorphum TaxID=2596890 RepID=A0A5S9IRY2_UABAM|nr:hypothetical protein [Candidatus Uabimicrobium amorphum]BBM86060.1 hypothetical protein UABAM_04446 [Candidatus Uabimicrobium amorphum]
MNKFINKRSLYYEALEGKHPDLSVKKKWIRHESESVNRAVTLYLRDIFTPLTLKFYEFITQISSQTIADMAKQFVVYENVYSDVIFEENAMPFLEGYQSIDTIDTSNSKFEDFANAYKALPEKMRAYYRKLLLHSKSVATLERYGLSDIVSGHYHSYLWSSIDNGIQTTSHAVDTTLVPIGEYGYNLSRTMVLTTNIMAKLTYDFFQKTAVIEDKYQQLIDNETARGREKQQALSQAEQMCHWQNFPVHCEHAQKIYQLQKEQRQLIIKESARFAAPDTFKEAIQSVQAALSSFYAQKVIEDPIAYLRTIISSGVAIQFAKIVPFGYTLPVVRRGRFYPHILQPKRNGLQLNPHFCQKARNLKEDYLKTRVYELDQRNPGFLGFGCPAAIRDKACKKTGIRYMLDCYEHIFKIVYHQNS